MTYTNCPPVLSSFLRYLEVVKNYKQNSIYLRSLDIRGFLQYHKAKQMPAMPEKLNELDVTDLDAAAVAAVTEDDIEEYLDYLLLQGKVTELTLYRRKVPSLRLFYEYLIRHQEDLGITIHKNPVREGRSSGAPSAPCRLLSPAEIQAVLRCCDGETAVRDKAIILLICTTGIAIPELVKIRYEDYREDTIAVGGRTLSLTENCQRAIDDYLEEFRDPAEDWLLDKTLFVSHNYRRRLSPRAVQKALQKYFDRANVVGTARDLRHTAVDTMLRTARNDCERAFIAGCLGYTPQKLRNLTFANSPNHDSTNLTTEGTWLQKLGGPELISKED